MFKTKYSDYLEMYCLKIDKAKGAIELNYTWKLALNYLNHKIYDKDIHWSELG